MLLPIIQTDPRNILLLIVSSVSFVLGVMVLKKAKNEPSARYFALIAFSIGLWVVSRALFQLTTGEFAAFWGYFLFIPAIIIVIFLLLFSIYVGSEKRRLNIYTKIAIVLPWLVGFIVTIIPGLVSKGYEISPTGINKEIRGSYFLTVYAPILLTYLVATLTILIAKYYKQKNLELKIKIRYIIFGVGISVGAAIIANIILPMFGKTDLVWAGPLFAIFLVVSVAYAISRKKLWDMHLILTEIAIFSLLIFSLVDIFVGSAEINIIYFKIASFLLMSLFSWFLIKGVFREIESRNSIKQLTDELSNANKRLHEIDIEKSEFVSIATHQLRTPLTVIKGYASMLLEETFGPIQNTNHKKIIKKIYEASQRLVKMIEDFLNISQIEKGKMNYVFEKFDFIKLVNDIIDEFKEGIEGEGTPILEHFDITKNIWVMGDELKVRQVIGNLLDNATKYSEDAKPIDVYIKKDKENITFSIKDKGMGLAIDAIPKLFRKFSRAGGMSKLHKEGRGLGLYIAKKIMIAHRGRIWVESPGEGHGSTFFVSFPIADEYMKRKEVKSFVSSIESGI